MSIVRKLVTSALLAGSFLAIGASDAFATCTSASTCARQLACQTGMELIKPSVQRAYCKSTTAATAKTPTCQGKGFLAKDWSWDPVYTNDDMNGKRGMCLDKKGKPNADVITCEPGATFNQTSRKCEARGSVNYFAPFLGVSTVASGGLTACGSNYASCIRTLTCAAGLTLTPNGSTGNHYCYKNAAVSTHTPLCVGTGVLAKNWTWDSTYESSDTNGQQGMCVDKSNKPNPDAIKCNAGYSFNQTSRKCEKPGGVVYTTPILVP